MQRYNPKQIEPKWQKVWEQNQTYRVDEDPAKPKRYVLEYFPYPSGAAMHVGHVRNYTIGDVIARYYRMQGYNVMHPMGWDAFGLPAENYAIKNNISPKQAIAENTTKFKQQLTQMGFSYDWSREINSSDPSYYKWTQWFFTLLFERGLAYQKESPQWWCETDKTVLANEQVEAGKCWRCGNVVTKKPLKQWFFKITDYADRLVEDLEDLDWSESIKSMQRNWIGKSRGAEVDFTVKDSNKTITVFTTRPDTLFGATFMVLAPEHPLVQQISTKDQKSAVDTYVQQAQAKSDVERQETDREKTGVFTGSYAVNPVNNEQIPIWIADYVLYGYGTGAIMAVPAHDERDYAFAKKFNIPIRTVVAQDFGMPLPNVQEVKGSVVVAYDPKQQKFIGVKTGTNDGLWLMGGGSEADETFEQTAIRELAEESGFTSYEKVIPLGEPVYSYYFNDVKKVNKRSFGQGFLFYVDATKQQHHAREAHETFELDWYSYEELVAGVAKVQGGVEHWLEMLRRAKNIVDGIDEPDCYSGDGVVINSRQYTGSSSSQVREKIVEELESRGVGREVVNYKIRDWLISRQRYWGAPIPIIHCTKCGVVPVPKEQLPVELPEVESYQPTGEGTSVLASVSDWVNTSCPKCGGPATRETDTMDGFACSSWYFLRFADPNNTEAPFDPEKAKFWLPVDDYIGGAEHAVMHLLYARMWTKVMYDAGMIDFIEPFKALRNQGMILAPDGRKMSKSWGNTITPGDIIEQGYGADAIRIMELFIGPWNQAANWSVEGMGGCYRFLQRYWSVVHEVIAATDSADNAEVSKELRRVTHQTIKKVTEDLHEMGFNTAIAAMMELVNELYKIRAAHGTVSSAAWRESITNLTQLLAPFAPHITEEVWEELGNTTSVHQSDWPEHNNELIASETMKIVVQVNGKLRATIDVPTDSDKAAVESVARSNENVQAHMPSEPKRVIYVPGKLLNFVV